MRGTKRNNIINKNIEICILVADKTTMMSLFVFIYIYIYPYTYNRRIKVQSQYHKVVTNVRSHAGR